VISLVQCKTCACEKEPSCFYASQPRKCKECVKASVREHRAANVDHYREFDRRRAQDPGRVAARLAYQQTEAFQESHRKACRKWGGDNPERRRAQIKVSNAIRDGRLIRQPCACCGELEVEGHHPDYGAPLDVVWLCPPHHRQLHEEHEISLADQPTFCLQET
jgi:hypothetical protein